MKFRTYYICQQCGYEGVQWYGKCPSCGAWNSLVETVKQEGKKGESGLRKQEARNSEPIKLSDVKHVEKNRLKSGFSEFDRVVGGGIVPGSVTLLSGDPGVGKSTILLNILASIGGVYATAEESAEQVKLRAKRMNIGGENIMILAETNLEAIIIAIENEKPKTAIIDSIQTIYSQDLDAMAGSVGQVRYCTEQLVRLAKTKNTSIIIIGHVTKEGNIAGPKILEHLVDTVLYLEGEKFANARLLKTFKNRFGAIEEVGIFEMKETGLKEIDNPSEMFLTDRVKGVPGSAVTVVLEGTRTLLLEIQALVVESQLAIPRRVTSGFDFNRLQVILAVLSKRLNIPLGTSDVFVNISGGMKIMEPASDLAVALAILSSFKNIPLDPESAAFGEIGLLGEIRRVSGEERRFREAKRLGFGRIISAANFPDIKKVMAIFKKFS